MDERNIQEKDYVKPHSSGEKNVEPESSEKKDNVKFEKVKKEYLLA